MEIEQLSFSGKTKKGTPIDVWIGPADGEENTLQIEIGKAGMPKIKARVVNYAYTAALQYAEMIIDGEL